MQKFLAPVGNVPTNSSSPASSPNKNPHERKCFMKVFDTFEISWWSVQVCENTWYFSQVYRGPMSLDRRFYWIISVVFRCFGLNSWDRGFSDSRRYHSPGDRAWHIYFIWQDTGTTTSFLQTGIMSLSVVFGSPEALFLLSLYLSWWIWLGECQCFWYYLGSTLFQSYLINHRLFSRWAGSWRECYRTEEVISNKIYPELWDSFRRCLGWSDENQT